MKMDSKTNKTRRGFLAAVCALLPAWIVGKRGNNPEPSFRWSDIESVRIEGNGELLGAIFPVKDQSGKEVYLSLTPEELAECPRFEDAIFRQAWMDSKPPGYFQHHPSRKNNGQPDAD
jgi:hypothetical protein